jgi:hypothetical protein
MIVVTEKATDALAPPNAPAGMLASNTIHQFVAEALMVAFAVVVDHELRERAPEVPLTQLYDPLQAFLFDRTNKPLRVCIAVGCSSLRHVRRSFRTLPSRPGRTSLSSTLIGFRPGQRARRDGRPGPVTLPPASSGVRLAECHDYFPNAAFAAAPASASSITG